MASWNVFKANIVTFCQLMKCRKFGTTLSKIIILNWEPLSIFFTYMLGLFQHSNFAPSGNCVDRFYMHIQILVQ